MPVTGKLLTQDNKLISLEEPSTLVDLKYYEEDILLNALVRAIRILDKGSPDRHYLLETFYYFGGDPDDL